MEIKEYSEVSSRTMSPRIFPDLVNPQTVHAAFGLSTESGEVLDCIKKSLFYGQPLDVANLREEIGDILFFWAMMCDSEGFDLSEIMEENVEKLRKRYPKGFSREHASLRLDKA